MKVIPFMDGCAPLHQDTVSSILVRLASPPRNHLLTRHALGLAIKGLARRTWSANPNTAHNHSHLSSGRPNGGLIWKGLSRECVG